MPLLTFINSTVVIFISEWILAFLIPWPIFLFPVFAVTLLLKSRNLNQTTGRLVFAGLAFDFFSGYEFGRLTLALLVLIFSIFLAKKVLAINPSSFLSLLIFSVLFGAEYLILFSFKVSVGELWFQLPFWFLQCLIILLIFTITFANDSRKIPHQTF